MKFLIKTNVHQDIASDKNLENLIHVKKKKNPNPKTMCIHITFVTMRTSKFN